MRINYQWSEVVVTNTPKTVAIQNVHSVARHRLCILDWYLNDVSRKHRCGLRFFNNRNLSSTSVHQLWRVIECYRLWAHFYKKTAGVRPVLSRYWANKFAEHTTPLWMNAFMSLFPTTFGKNSLTSKNNNLILEHHRANISMHYVSHG